MVFTTQNNFSRVPLMTWLPTNSFPWYPRKQISRNFNSLWHHQNCGSVSHECIHSVSLNLNQTLQIISYIFIPILFILCLPFHYQIPYIPIPCHNWWFFILNFPYSNFCVGSGPEVLWLYWLSVNFIPVIGVSRRQWKISS